MSENVLQTLQQLVQDVIAPDVRELKVRLASMEKQNEIRFAALEQRFSTREKQSEMPFKSIMSAIAESKAQGELTQLRMITAPSGRVAVLESRRQ